MGNGNSPLFAICHHFTPLSIHYEKTALKNVDKSSMILPADSAVSCIGAVLPNPRSLALGFIIVLAITTAAMMLLTTLNPSSSGATALPPLTDVGASTELTGNFSDFINEKDRLTISTLLPDYTRVKEPTMCLVNEPPSDEELQMSQQRRAMTGLILAPQER